MLSICFVKRGTIVTLQFMIQMEFDDKHDRKNTKPQRRWKGGGEKPEYQEFT